MSFGFDHFSQCEKSVYVSSRGFDIFRQPQARIALIRQLATGVMKETTLTSKPVKITMQIATRNSAAKRRKARGDSGGHRRNPWRYHQCDSGYQNISSAAGLRTSRSRITCWCIGWCRRGRNYRRIDRQHSRFSGLRLEAFSKARMASAGLPVCI